MDGMDDLRFYMYILSPEFQSYQDNGWVGRGVRRGEGLKSVCIGTWFTLEKFLVSAGTESVTARSAGQSLTY